VQKGGPRNQALVAHARDFRGKRRHDFRPLWKEAKELHLIFTSILKHRGKEKGEI
jgi:hypothetical protein